MSQYVISAVSNVGDTISNNRKSLPNREEILIKIDYRPELDVTLELVPVQAAHYQSLIGIIR